MSSRLFWVSVALAGSVGVASAQDHDWTGVYVGASVGVTGSESDASVRYDDPGASYSGSASVGAPHGRWENGMYVSDLAREEHYDNVRASTTSGPTYAYGGTLTSVGSLEGTSLGVADPISPWVNSIANGDINAVGSLRIGANYQLGPVVFGAEVDASLMKQAVDKAFAIGEGATIDASTSQCIAGSPCTTTYYTDYQSEYSQSGGFTFESEASNIRTARARLGLAAGPVLVYATGGVASGDIRMKTSASVSEQVDNDWSGDTGSSPTDVGSGGVTNNTSWSASDSETKYGFAVGGGASYAVTDNVILTLDGYYYDLGRHSLTAVDSHGETSYTVSQDFDGYVVRSGLEYQF